MKSNTFLKGLNFLIIAVVGLACLSGLLDLISYIKMFQVGMREEPFSYVIYALCYIGQLITFVYFSLMVYKVAISGKDSSTFSDKIYVYIVSSSICLILFIFLNQINLFLPIQDKFVDVLPQNSFNITMLILTNLLLSVFATTYRKSQKLKEENDLTI